MIPDATALPRGPRVVLIWCSVVATSFVTLEPLFVGKMIDQLALSHEVAGYLAAVLIAASAGGNLLLIAIGTGRSLRQFLFVSTAVLAITELASVFTATPPLLLAVRLINAIAAGVLFGTVNAFAAREPARNRLFAVMLSAQLSFGAACQVLLSLFPGANSLRPIFLAACLLAIPVLMTARRLPGEVTLPARNRGSSSAHDPRLLRLLGSLLLMYVGTTAIWVYLERIGVDGLLPRQTIHLTLALGMLAGLAGGLLAWRLANRPDPHRCIIAGLGLVAAGVVLLQFGSATAYAIGGAALNFGQVFVIPFYLSLLASPPTGQRDVVLAGPVISLGLILGPLLGGLAVGWPGYLPLVAASTLLLILSMIVMPRNTATPFTTFD